MNPARKRFLEYDAHGNVVWIEAEPSGDGSALEFKYDHENRLVWHEASSGATTTYAYDALGRRIEKAVNQKITRYIYSGDRIVEERDGSGNVLTSYVYGRGLDEPALMRRDVDRDGTPEDYYFHSDDQHNTWFLSDENGNVVEAYAYGSVLDPYIEVDGALVQFPNDFGVPVFLDPATGEPRPVAFTDTGIPTFVDTGQPYESEFGNPFLFNGREWDPELGFYHYRTRHLDPLTGRFTSPDPLGAWGDPLNLGNPYTYVGNNPWNYTDPYGLQYQAVFAPAPLSPPKRRVMNAAIGGFFNFGGEDFRNMEELITFAPVVGIPADLHLTWQDWDEGHYIMAGVSLFGALPVLGDVVSGLVRSGADWIKPCVGWFTRSGANLTRQGISAAEGASALQRGWKVGDPIDRLTAVGNAPKWRTVQNRHWKNEAFYHNDDYSADNLERMRRGLAEQRVNLETGKLESRHLHHDPLQRDGNLFQFEPVWPKEHALLEEQLRHRRP